MKRYFFDVVSPCRSEFDYRGREFASPEKAYALAELIALDLGISPQGEWTGFTVNVHDSQGRKFYSQPVAALELAAA
ncbi:MAG: hypothetical protein QOI12_5148 [Alphaproteobacteria bacterium]|jgi:hypothetical protein|nr:hypothetical protein [Alphaproteobacteria bacterium]